MAEELSKIYEPKIVEKQANEVWLSNSYFHAEACPDAGKYPKGSYTIVIPPPNVTAALHLGHALNNTLQDILIRFRRMQGYDTLWMPGTDHAGIATQTMVDKRLQAEGQPSLKDYKKLEQEGGNGRSQFLARVQAWKDEYEAMIIDQLKAMGCSCDWQRTRFTMDEVCAKAVRTAFFKLFSDGLIYRGKRLVNWDPATQTVLADDEVEHETIAGHFWYLRYPLAEPVEIDGPTIEHVTVATTRPETMLGDTAVAMNPADPRAKYLVGKMVVLPIVGRLIPIIADEMVVLPDPESEDEKARFSTGFLKVTPAHDPTDWEIGLRHNLEVINVMAPDASISDKHGWTDWNDIKNPDVENLIGMDRFETREAVVEWFRQENLLEDVREYAHEVGHSYRSHVPIEPYLSDQWYIAVKKPIERLAEKFGTDLIEGTDVPLNSLAGLALKPLLDARLRFIPERYAATYRTWLENLRDWPISRQLWWGHRIPVWRKVMAQGQHMLAQLFQPPILGIVPNNGADSELFPFNFHVKGLDYDLSIQVWKEDGKSYNYTCVPSGREDVERELENRGWERDLDVLDTWFSSALWPFSTMGWPEDTPEMKTFYPGDVLCTAREIITLWVTRMVMMGQYCAGDIPFKDVFIHAMIQDGEGRKMSKSLGNGIDPLVAIDSHGADAMRFTLASMTTETQDVRMPVAPMQLPDGRTVNTSPKFDIGRNFCNKLWNASRFAMLNLEGTDPEAFDSNRLSVPDKWILSRLARAIEETTAAIEAYKYSDPLMALYRFFWNDFCDWYLEWTKPQMRDENQKPTAQNVLAFVLDRILRLLHPFVPFITEGIFQKLNEIVPIRGLKGIAQAVPSPAIVIAGWPENMTSLIDSDVENVIESVQTVIRIIRDIRSTYNKSPGEKLTASASAPKNIAGILNQNAELVCQLASLRHFEAGEGLEKPKNAASAIVEQVQVYLHEAVDPQAERQRLQKQKEQLQKVKASMEAKLANESFVSRAKPVVVAQSRAKLAELTGQLETVEKHLQELD